MKTNWFKRTLCSILVLVLVLGCVPVTAQAQDGQEASVSNDVTLEGSSSFGNLLTNTVNESQTPEADANYDGRICDLVIEGTTATVEYTTPVEANLVVAIYDQDSGKMLGSGTLTVSPEETIAEVAIEIPAMPYYFRAGAFLLDAGTNDPVSEEFKTDRYTKVMQDILAATVDDFNEELVLNLDDDRTTNFAVFNENTLRAEEGTGTNRVTDNGGGTYTIENADAQFLSMQPGDTFAYTYPDGTVLIVNAASVTVDGDTVTVTENPDADLSAVFDFVKIEEDSNGKKWEYDDSTLAEGVTIIRNAEPAERASISAFSNTIGTGVSGSVGNKFEISEDVIEEDGKKVSLSASITHKMTVNLKLYLSYDYISVSFSVEESRSTTVSLNGSLSIIKFSLGSYDITLCAGVYVHIDPSFIIQASGAMSHTSEQKKITGYSYDSDNGWQDISAPPSQKIKVEFSGKLFYGMEFKAGISIITERIVDLSIKIKAGIELAAKDKVDSLSSPSSSEIHMCNICYEGEISLILATDIEFQVFGGFIKDKFTLAEGKWKLSDIYYSVDFSTPDSPDMGFSKCPHKLYKFSLTVRSVWHRPIQDATLSLYQDGKELNEVYLLDSTGTLIKSAIPSTDKEGTSIFYLPNGYYTIVAEYNGRTITDEITVLNSTTKLNLEFQSDVEHDVLFLSDYELSLYSPGPSQKITARYFDVDVTSDCQWQSSDTNVAIVSSNGEVMPISAGTAVVTASYTSLDGTHSAQCNITVTSVSALASGKCGENLSWILTYDGALLFTGSGEMQQYSSVKSVPWYTWRDEITQVSLSNKMVNISSFSFYNCINLTSVHIPDGISCIGDYAFYGCSSLTDLSIPKSITNIEYNAFQNTEQLSVHISDLSKWCNIDFSSYDSNPLINDGKLYINNVLAESLEIPYGISRIRKYAFAGSGSLMDLSIASSVRTIEERAFSRCKALKTVDIAEGVEQIGLSAFSGCTSLTSISIPNSLTSLADYLFSDCSNLVSVSIPDSITSIGNGAFNNCAKLMSISIPNNLVSIGNSAFLNCSSLISLDIPNSVISIGSDAFKMCSSLANVTISNQLTDINSYVFAGCSRLTKVDIPDSVTSIGGNAFAGCSNLTSIVIPEKVATVGQAAFYNCAQLTSVDLSENITSIGPNAFRKCTSLTSIIIPDSITLIDTGVFQDCSSLTNVTLSAVLTSIGDDAFRGCINISSLNIPDSVSSLGLAAFYGCESLTHISIPKGVSRIENDTFYGCTNLTGIDFPDSITYIGKNAFHSCKNLANVSIPDSVSYIGRSAFANCESLTDINIPDGVTDIFDYSFMFCRNLNSISIPSSLNNIGEYAFHMCSNLEYIYYSGTLSQWNAITIGKYNSSLDNAALVLVTSDLATASTMSGEDVVQNDQTIHSEAPTEVPAGESTEPTVEPLPEVIGETEAAPEPIEESLPPVEEPLPEESAGEDEEELLLEEVSDRLWYSAPAGAEMTVVPVLQKLSAFTGAESVKNGIRSVKFTGLEPGEEYVLIVSLIPGSLVPQNLLYIDQDNAAADGTLSFTYIPRQDVSAQVRLCGIPAGRTVTLDRDYITMNVGTAPQKLTAVVTPEEWSGDLTWSSTDPAVITVNEFGDVTPIAPGTAYAVATVTHGAYTFSARCRVDVTEKQANQEVTGVQLGTTALTAELFRTDYAELDVILQLKQNLMQSQARTVFSAPGAKANNGVSIDDARFENEKAAALFDLVVKDDRTLLVVPKEEAINNPKTVAGKYVSKVIVNVDGKEFVTDASLTLTVKKSTPKLKAAALTFNTFYTGQSQAIQITGATVTDIESKSRPEWLMLENGVLKLAENAPAKASGKVTVRVKTAEWVDNISIDLTIPVKTAYAAPKLKLSASTITLPTFANPDDYGYYAGGQWLQLLCSAKGDTLERLNVAYIEAPSGWYIQEDSEGWFWLRPNAGRQISAGKITLKVHFSNTDSVVPLTLTVKTKNTPIMIITPDYLHSAKLNSRIEDGFFLRNLTSNAWLNWEQYDLDLKILDKYGNNVVGSMFYVSDDLNYICTLPGTTKAGTYRMTLDLRDSEGNLRTEKSSVVTITVLPASTKPSVSVKALDAIDYTFSDNPRTRLQVTFKNFRICRITNMYYSVTLGKEDMTDQFDLYYDDSVWSWVLKPKGEVPTGSYTLKLDACMDEQHPEEVIYSCSVKITVKRTPVKLKLSKTSLSLNKAIGDTAVVDVTCQTKGYDFTQPIAQLILPGSKDGQDIHLNVPGSQEPLTVSWSGGKLTVTANATAEAGKTYKVVIKATEKDPAVTLSVKILDAPVTASLKAAGAIDVVRDSTAITVTPAYKNYMGLSEINPVLTIESWSGKKGEDYQPVAEGLFGITPNANGTFTITKVPGAEADTTLKYRAKLTFYSYAKPAYVNLAVKSGTAKVVVSNSIVLYKTDRFSRGTFRLTTADKTLNSIVKAEIKDAKYRNLFEIHSYGNGEFALGFKDNLIPAGKLPTSVALNVFCDGSDKSVATVTLKLQVR